MPNESPCSEARCQCKPRRIGFAYCHGWSFDAQSLAPLRQALSWRFPGTEEALFDLGFGGDARSPLLSADVDWIAVGHSYGFAYLMQQAVSWKAAVSINGFTRFCRHPGQAEGTPVRRIDAMLNRLDADPQAIVRDFHRRCGAEQTNPPHLDASRLREHLTRLRHLDMVPTPCPTLALFTRDDTIVPPELAQACFGRSGCTLEQTPGDHMRLLREPEFTANAVYRFMEHLRAC